MRIKQFHIVQVAAGLFLKQGYEQVSMADIASEANIPEAELFTHFGNKQDMMLFLYQSINTDWQIGVNNLTDRKLADRFEKAMIVKIQLMEPYVGLLADMLSLLVRNPKIGIHAPRTSHIRALGLQTMQTIITGARDSSSFQRKLPQLPSLLYLVHWAILFLYLQTNDHVKTAESIRLAAKMLKQANSFAFLLRFFPLFNDASAFADNLITQQERQDHTLDREILKIIFNFRKTIAADEHCLTNACETCFLQHEGKIGFFTDEQKPLHFILPAFPAKSPNSSKVLGTLPDLGEKIALQALEDLCKEIKSIYEPGAHMVICSDGRIFSELVGVTDDQVSRYVNGIQKMIDSLKLQHVSIVNLEDLLPGDTFDNLREQVLQSYAEPLDELAARLKADPEFKGLFNGIHRFITEDRKAMQSERSKSQVKEESKGIALKVIQHSNAWTRFLAYVYPDAIRLSIHPYPAHSDKIGIQLTKATDNWLTPWHGVIVLQEDGYVLMKKSEAEAKDARLVYEKDQPYYYTLIPE